MRLQSNYKMAKRGKQTLRSTTLARIDTGVLIYLKRNFGNINNKLRADYPEALAYVTEETNPDQLELFKEELNSNFDKIEDIMQKGVEALTSEEIAKLKTKSKIKPSNKPKQ